MANHRSDEPTLNELELTLLIFHSQIGQNHPSEDAVEEARERLRVMGLLHDHAEDIETADETPLTDRGVIHLDYLLSRALPQRRRVWIHDED